MVLIQLRFNSAKKLEPSLRRPNMTAAVKILVVLLLCLSWTSGTKYPQLRFLDKLINIIHNEKTFHSIIIVQHSRNKNCTLQHWNPHDIPIIRTNELSPFKVRGVFNSQLMAMVCIDGDSNSLLFHVLAKALEGLRQERIILWTQREPTKPFLANVARHSIKFKFLQIIILATGDHPRGVTSIYLMKAFPSPHFDQIKNISGIPSPVFRDPRYSYQGTTAIVKRSDNLEPHISVKSANGDFPISRLEDMEIIEFAWHYNLSLKVRKEDASRRDHFDIQLNPRFITVGDLPALDFVNPSTMSTLMAVVPCSNKRNVVDFLRKLGVPTLVWYLLPVYITFVLVETFVLVVTNRISGQPYRPTNLNALLSLRAFRAILGLPFPESRRASLSLRQLSLAITLFGFVFSNFFSCKLSALLTKPLAHPEITNFEELRASGLTTILVEYIRSFIENEIDPEFFHQVVPKIMILGPVDRLKLLISFNDSYSFIINSKNWLLYDSFQRSLGKKVFCTSEDLIIVKNLPRMYVTERNSIFKWVLSRFVMFIQEAGIIEHWKTDQSWFIKTVFNITTPRNVETEVEPISMEQLKWLLELLGMGYGIATFVFIVEILIKKR